MIGARIGAGLQIAGARLNNPSQTALRLDRATMADVDAAAITAYGAISLTGCRLTGHLNLAGASLVNRRRLHAGRRRSKHQRHDRPHEVNSAGEMTMKATHVGGSILLTSTTIDHLPGNALDLSRSDASDVLLRA